MNFFVGGFFGFLVEYVVGKVVFGFFDVVVFGCFFVDGVGDGVLENVFFFFGEVVEDFGCEVEVLGDDFFGCVFCLIG